MFIKVEVEFLDTVFYEINQDRFSVGSAKTNHICLKLPSISKRHVEFIFEDNAWKVSDLGSTNGTYLADQKMAKNKPLELLPEETVRLGDMVYLTITEEAQNPLALPVPESIEEPEELPLIDPDKTQVISLTSLERARLNSARKKKKQLLEKKAEARKRQIADGQLISKILSIIFILLGLAWGANKLWIERMKKVEKEYVLKKMQTKFTGDLEIEADLEGLRIPRAQLFSRQKMSKFLTEAKCQQEEIKEFCGSNPLFSTLDNGVVFVPPTDYIFFLDEKTYLANTQFLVHEADKPKARSLIKFAFLTFYKDYMEGKELVEGSRVYLAFYSRDNLNNFKLKNVAGYASERGHMISAELESMKFPGPFLSLDKALTRLDKYFTVY